jgi:8-oxo-dGTP pyrophosphatase MutT (NUDIX family)
MQYAPVQPLGVPILHDPYFQLMADAEGVGFIHCGDGVLVVPMTGDGQVLLAIERSPAFGREILTLVSGAVEEGEPLEETANRELQEELGWRADRIDFLGEIHPFKYLDSRQFVFLARGLVLRKLEGDERHPVRTRSVSLSAWPGLCERGELQDALAIAALCLAESYLAGRR